MSVGASFDQLIARLRDGSQGAASDLFTLYAGRLLALARSRLSERIRLSVDPEDVVQSALRSFFVRHRDGRIEVTGWESLWSLLAVITLRKCVHQVEHFQAARRDVRREQRASPADSGTEMDFLGKEPTPEQAAMLAEIVERIMAELEPREREILSQHLQGYPTEDIAVSVSRSKRTVERVLERVRLQLERWSDEA